uniref:Glycosyltransferase family 92 protein n=1 Tax=Caenorhabditis tropicalis TaxID=1561998 RepID=A0A1I7TWU1_9PELO
MNICILDIKTTMGTVADFDEVLVPRNGRLIEYATKEMMNMNIGALSFENNYVVMEPSIYTSNFSGVLSPVLTERRGPTKYIFKTAEIDIAETHWPKSFIDASKTTKTTDGALLHFRFDAVKRTKVQTSHWYKMFLPKFFSEKVTKPFRFFPDNSFKHLQNMHDTVFFLIKAVL